MKKLPYCLLATTMALGLAACAAKSTPPATSPEPQPAEGPPPVEAEPAATEPAAEPEPARSAASTTPTADLIDTADGMGTFTTFLKLVEEAGLTQALHEDGPLTLLVPDDAAFAKLAAGELDKLRKDKKSLTALVNNHVLPGRAIKSVELGTMPTARTAAGPEITIDSADGTIKLNGAGAVVKADVMTTNGVIHVIDIVLTPGKRAKKGK
ncbi:MAG: fasciclin domain-containing protein [Nannocystis sp.]|nr:fasciclin domain-containing protein [Nannocystis sp.]MBA3547853.1 fasciclin domain-containing protein [Nannocystis sp.]